MANLNQNPIVFANTATGTQPGVVQLNGDFDPTSTYTAPVLSKIRNITLPTGAPTSGQVLTATSGTTLSWNTPSAGSAKKVTTGTYAATFTPNADTTDILRITLAGNITMNTPSGSPVAGQTLQMELTQDGTGSRTVSFGAGYSASTDIPFPTLTTTANKMDMLLFQYSAAASSWRLVGVIKGF